jgi:hypothetical protein
MDQNKKLGDYDYLDPRIKKAMEDNIASKIELAEISSRLIEFNAWHKIRKEMYKVHGWHSEYVFKDTLDGVGCEGNPDKLEDVELLQFIGVKDVRNNKLFEGDILEWAGMMDTKFIITFIKGAYYACHKSDEILISDGRFCFKIGNIYENPELINP